MTTKTPTFIDALPYIDTAIDDDEDQLALAVKEVDDECEVYPPKEDYLADMPGINDRRFVTSLLKRELDKLEQENGRTHDGIPISQIEVDVPPPMSTEMSEEQLKLWEKSLNQLKIKLEYRQRQLINLELLKNYGLPAWSQYIAGREKLEADLNSELDDIKKRTEQVNFRRKTDQEAILKTLQVLKNEWNNLVEKNKMLSREIALISK